MRLLVLPGDGIGPEITAATLPVLRAAEAALDPGPVIGCAEIGRAARAAQRPPRPEAMPEPIPPVDAVIPGPVSHGYPGGPPGTAAFAGRVLEWLKPEGQG